MRVALRSIADALWPPSSTYVSIVRPVASSRPSAALTPVDFSRSLSLDLVPLAARNKRRAIVRLPLANGGAPLATSSQPPSADCALRAARR